MKGKNGKYYLLNIYIPISTAVFLCLAFYLERRLTEDIKDWAFIILITLWVFSLSIFTKLEEIRKRDKGLKEYIKIAIWLFYSPSIIFIALYGLFVANWPYIYITVLVLIPLILEAIFSYKEYKKSKE